MVDPITQNQYIGRVGDLSSNCSVLTSSILSDLNQVFYADSIVDPLSSPTNLSIRYVTSDEYHDLVVSPDAPNVFEPKTLYVISSDQINAYNTQIKNVADPLSNTDAANKQWVESMIQQAIQPLQQRITALENMLNA